MKNKTMRRVVALLLCLLMAASFAACTGSGETSQGTSSAPAGNETPETPEGGEKLKISLATTNDPTGDEMNQRKYENFWMPIIEEYEETYPDREVEYTAYIWETIDAKLMSDYAAGIERGVSLLNSSQLATLYKNGSLFIGPAVMGRLDR